MEFNVHQSEDAIYTVYKITGPTGKIYIGCTGQKPERRWQNGFGYKRGQPYFYADIEKYGWGAFQKEIVCEKLLKEGAEKLEKFLVDYYDTCDPEKGYNVFTGGSRTGATCSAAGKERNSLAVKAAYKRNPGIVEKMKIRAMKQYTAHPETLARSRESQKKLWTPEYRQKMSEIRLEYYKSHSVDLSPKAVICIETGAIFKSLNAAERATGVNHGTIGGVCRGLHHTAGGLHWAYWKGENEEPCKDQTA